MTEKKELTAAALLLSEKGNATKKATAKARREKVKQLKTENPDWNARRIAQELGLRNPDGTDDNVRLVRHDLTVIRKEEKSEATDD